MKKVIFLLLGLCFTLAIAGSNASAFSANRALNIFEVLKYEKGSEFIKLTFEEYTLLTGKNNSLWNKITFNAAKIFIGIVMMAYQKVIVLWIDKRRRV